MEYSTPQQRTRFYTSTLPEAFAAIRKHLPIDWVVLALLLLFANRHLILMKPLDGNLIFLPRRVMDGEWWRLVTFPFVHLSWYHFLLDAGAFWLLYTGLKEPHLSRRSIYIAACAAGSLAAAWVSVPEIEHLGLCGLSGVAHGLMAVAALECLVSGSRKAAGSLSLVLVFSKSILETINGEVLFGFLHLGLCGTPVAACHLGGVAGGISGYLMILFFCDDAAAPSELLKGDQSCHPAVLVR